jgi:hypothetical protein
MPCRFLLLLLAACLTHTASGEVQGLLDLQHEDQVACLLPIRFCLTALCFARCFGVCATSGCHAYTQYHLKVDQQAYGTAMHAHTMPGSMLQLLAGIHISRFMRIP